MGEAPLKIQLGEALKEELQQKPLSKVTVSSLVNRVGVTRQAFYYHFVDIYDLAVWVFEHEVASHIMSHATYADWARGFEQLLSYMRDNKMPVYQVIKSLSHEDLELFFYKEFRAMMEAIVKEKREGLQLTDSSAHFIADHFALVVLGYTMHWLSTDMRADPAQLVPRIELLMHGQVRSALETFAALDTGSHTYSRPPGESRGL